MRTALKFLDLYPESEQQQQRQSETCSFVICCSDFLAVSARMTSATSRLQTFALSFASLSSWRESRSRGKTNRRERSCWKPLKWVIVTLSLCVNCCASVCVRVCVCTHWCCKVSNLQCNTIGWSDLLVSSEASGPQGPSVPGFSSLDTPMVGRRSHCIMVTMPRT